MYCNNCGSKNSEGSKFCNACGAALVDGAANVMQFSLADNAPAQKAGKSKAVWALIKLVAGLGFIIGGYFLGQNSGWISKMTSSSNAGGAADMGSLVMYIVGGLFLVDMIFGLFRKKK